MKIREAKIVESDDSFSKALDELLKSGTAVVVVKNKKLIGIIDDRNVKPKGYDPSKIKAGSVAVKCPSIKKNANLEEQIELFLNGHFKALPVVDEKGRIIGITTRSDVLNEILKNHMIPSIPIRQIVGKKLHTIDYDAKIKDAKKKMNMFGVHRLVVVKNGKAYGTITTFDFFGLIVKPKGRQKYQLISEIKNIDEKPIKEILREKLVDVDDDSTLLESAKKMVKNDVSSVVVVSGGRPVGVITATDIFKLVKKLLEKEEEVLISGLDEDTLIYYDDIKGIIEHVVKKFKKSMKIEDIKVHIKKGKSMFESALHLTINNKPIVIKCAEHKFSDLIASMHEELKTVLEKTKTKKISRRKRVGS